MTDASEFSRSRQFEGRSFEPIYALVADEHRHFPITAPHGIGLGRKHNGSLANLAEVTLRRTFVRPPPQEFGAMTETMSRDLVKAHFDNKLRFQRLPV